MTTLTIVTFAALTLHVTGISGPGGTRDNATEIAWGVNLADCLDPSSTTITVRVDEAIEEGLDLWVSAGGDCAVTSARTGDGATCFDIGRNVDDLDGDGELTVTLAELAAGDVDACAATASGGATVRLWVFDSGQESTTGELGDIATGDVELKVDPVPPDAPEITSDDGSGATAVAVAWDEPTDGDAAALEYLLLGEAAGPGCTSSEVTLRAGEAAPEGAVLLASVTGATRASVDPSTDELGLADGDAMLVGVVATDPAGNVSVVSSLVCITREPTAGYCDVLEEEGHACAAGCAIAGSDATLLGAIPLLALLAWRTRRRAFLPLLLGAMPALADDRPATLTLGAGITQPDATRAFATAFGDEKGPLLGAELQLGLVHIPRVGWLGAGVGAGWASYGGRTCKRTTDGDPDCTKRTTEEATLTVVPLTALASLRVETLARELGVPLVVTPKLGLESIYYRSSAGRITDGEGLAHGLRWAVEVALELDGLDPAAASALRRDGGVEHAFVYAQVHGSVAQSTVVSDALAWTAGLGFSF